MASRRTESGFSLPELLMAMVVTLIVSGAIFGLIASGQSAFHREPEVIDRQQNIRMAMDLIMRDIGTAGIGMALPGQTSWLQAFSRTSAESGGSLESCQGGTHNEGGGVDCPPSTLRSGQRTDDLEILTNPDGHDPEEVCGYQGGGSNIRTKYNYSHVPSGGIAIVIMEDGTWTAREIVSSFNNKGGPGNCESNTLHADLSWKSGGCTVVDLCRPTDLCKPVDAGLGTVSGSSCNPTIISAGQVITYHIRKDAQGVPHLYRRATGSMAGNTTMTGAYQLIARGVEDMQVEYATAADPSTFVPRAPAVVSGNYGSLITAVRVTLSARSTARKMTGASVGDNTLALRGALTSTGSVRAALNSIANSPGPTWEWR